MDSPLHILHLEDNDLDVELIQATLAAEGLTGDWVRVQKRDDFLAAVEAGGIDLILADYELPAFDGMSALALAKSLRPEVPFLFVSGALGEERAIETLKEGATDYVLKTRLNRLAPAIRRALREAGERAQRQRAQAEVYAERERLRITLASIGDAVIATDVEGRITFLNPMAQALTGWSEPQAVGQPIDRVVHLVDEHSRTPIENPVIRVLRDRAAMALTNHTVLIAKSGRDIPIDDSGAPIYDEQKHLIGVVLVFRDTRERRESETALRESEERYRSLVAATTSVVWTTDAAGQMTTPSLSWEAYTGQPWPQYAGRGWLEMVHPDDRESLRVKWVQAVTGRTFFRAEARLWHAASGEYHHYLSRAVPLIDAQGQVREWVGTVTDVHERRLAQKMALETAGRIARTQAIVAELSQALTPDRVVDVIVHHGVALLEAHGGLVTFLSPDGAALEIAQSAGYPKEKLANFQSIPLSAPTLISQVAQSRQPAWIESIREYRKQFPERAMYQAGDDYEAVAVVPLIFEEQMLGTLGFSFAGTKIFSPSEREVILTLARQCALALERARLFEAEQQARAEAQALNVTLEARVGERTAQLESANSDLQKEIGERRQVEHRIRQSEQRLAEAQHIARMGSWYWDVEKNMVTWSIEMCRIYGLNPEAFNATLEGFLDCVHSDDREIVREWIAVALHERIPISFDHRILRPDGTVRSVSTQAEVVLDDQGNLLALSGTAQDISERKQIEEELRTSREQLRQLSSYLQAAREEERTRISREIHDQFGGALMALKMDLRQLQKNMVEKSYEPATQARRLERIDAMADLIDGMAQNIRRIAADLRPGILDDLGLEAAIEWQLQDFQARSGIRCKLISKVGDLRLTPDGATALFRIFQETLTNVARHAQATRVEVYLDEETDQLVLKVHDNGLGISEQDVTRANSLGLVGMRERIRLLAGDLNIQGVPGQGTTILARIPLRRNTLT